MRSTASVPPRGLVASHAMPRLILGSFYEWLHVDVISIIHQDSYLQHGVVPESGSSCIKQYNRGVSG